MRTVWVVQGSRNGEWLLIHFPARRAGVLCRKRLWRNRRKPWRRASREKNAVGFDKTRNPHEKLHFAALPH